MTTSRRGGMQRGEALGVVAIQRRQADLVELAHERERPQVVLALDAGTDDRERPRVAPGEHVR